MARLASTPDCLISGCARARTKGELCAKHHAMVPVSMVIEGMAEGMAAQQRIARKHHRKQRLYVAARLKEAG